MCPSANEAAAGTTSISAASATHLTVKSHKGHKHSKQASDPFLELTDDAILDPPTPDPDNKNDSGHGLVQSLLVHVVLTPIIMVSFLLSLFVVDYNNATWRLSQHSSGSNGLSWLDPRPYQDSHAGQDTSAGGRDRTSPSYSGWYMHKKHRALAKLEISDAFEMRGRMMYALLAWVLLACCTVGYLLRQICVWMWS